MCKCFPNKCAHPVEIDDRVFLLKRPGLGTPEVWSGPTGVTVVCFTVRCRAPPGSPVVDGGRGKGQTSPLGLHDAEVGVAREHIKGNFR